jgi:hypothetical protein
MPSGKPTSVPTEVSTGFHRNKLPTCHGVFSTTAPLRRRRQADERGKQAAKENDARKRDNKADEDAASRR